MVHCAKALSPVSSKAEHLSYKQGVGISKFPLGTVIVAEWFMPWIVSPVNAGSSPVDHPAGKPKVGTSAVNRPS